MCQSLSGCQGSAGNKTETPGLCGAKADCCSPGLVFSIAGSTEVMFIDRHKLKAGPPVSQPESCQHVSIYLANEQRQ